MVSVGGAGEELNTGTLAAVPPALSPKPHNSVSPYMTLYLPSQDGRLGQSLVNACEEFCTGPLRGCLGFQQPSISRRQMECLLIFIVKCYMGSTSQP